jgi:hypothetical protein
MRESRGYNTQRLSRSHPNTPPDTGPGPERPSSVDHPPSSSQRAAPIPIHRLITPPPPDEETTAVPTNYGAYPGGGDPRYDRGGDPGSGPVTWTETVPIGQRAYPERGHGPAPDGRATAVPTDNGSQEVYERYENNLRRYITERFGPHIPTNPDVQQEVLNRVQVAGPGYKQRFLDHARCIREHANFIKRYLGPSADRALDDAKMP